MCIDVFSKENGYLVACASFTTNNVKHFLFSFLSTRHFRSLLMHGNTIIDCGFWIWRHIWFALTNDTQFPWCILIDFEFTGAPGTMARLPVCNDIRKCLGYVNRYVYITTNRRICSDSLCSLQSASSARLLLCATLCMSGIVCTYKTAVVSLQYLQF